METPLSMRRITRSLAASTSAQKSVDAVQLSRTKGGKNGGEPRAALHDITNDSPIVGLAAGGLQVEKTPASRAAKSLPMPRRTPGSGEALLRGQVKTLLQKVDEEGVVKPVAVTSLLPIRALLGVSRSPAQLLAPTPANTPQVGAVSEARDALLVDGGAMPCVVEEEEWLPKQNAAEVPPVEENLSECQLHRALVFDDSPGKSDLSNVSVVSTSLSFQESSSYPDKSSSPDDDSSSAWSIQVNASSEKGDEEEVVEEYTEEEMQEEGEDYFDDLCEGMSKMSVFDGEDEEAEEEEKVGLPEFKGKHTRFIYNSDDEIEREEVVSAAGAGEEDGVLVLRGLPVPEGKHLRFQEELEE